MKYLLLSTGLVFFGLFHCEAQNDSISNSAIKLFVDPRDIQDANKDLPAGMPDRLYRKITSIINQTGITEVGYSTFYVLPKLDIISISKSQTGTTNVYLATCEMSITINRVSVSNNLSDGFATFKSYSKKITGSGLTENDAKINVLNNLSAQDKDISQFFVDARQSINNYFKANCKDVMKQADRALDINNYALAIALYFSIPSTADCYDKAMESSKGVYNQYISVECEKLVLKLKTLTTMAQNDNDYYDDIVNLINNSHELSPSCTTEINQIMSTLEKRLTEEQKQKWELVKKIINDDSQVEKEKYKAMADMAKSYQPPATVVVTH